MKKRDLYLCLACALCPCLQRSVIAQAAPQVTVQFAEGPPKSSDEVLASKGIQLTGPALVSALQNRDPEIRALAAGSLAQHYSDAAPLIENALAIEPDPQTQIAMADALWGLKDPKGVEHLHGMCEKASTPVWVLVGVVQNLSSMGASTSVCFDPIVNYAESGADTSERRQKVLPALPGLFRGGDSEKAVHIVSMLEAMLTDEAQSVRIAASGALVEIHSRSSSVALQKAISQEPDPEIRSSLQNDLVRLEKDTAGGQPPLP